MHLFHDTQIDHDHDQVISHLDALSRLTLQDAAARRDMVAYLLHYVADHAGREEAIMRAAGYPDLAAHAEAHRELQEEFARLSRPVLEAVPGQDYCRLRRLFLTHIVAWDEAFGEWLAERTLDHVS
jgi:hemerythrin-like metal-binding protein